MTSSGFPLKFYSSVSSSIRERTKYIMSQIWYYSTKIMYLLKGSLFSPNPQIKYELGTSFHQIEKRALLTLCKLEQEILNFCEGLRVIGLEPEEKLALFGDNSSRWLVSDQGIMATGAINVVRGSRSSVEELFQIYNHSERGRWGHTSAASEECLVF